MAYELIRVRIVPLLRYQVDACFQPSVYETGDQSQLFRKGSRWIRRLVQPRL